MLPSQCQMFRVNGVNCDKLVQGVMIMPDTTPMAAYKDGQAFCAKHLDDLLKVNPEATMMSVQAMESLRRTMPSMPVNAPVVPASPVDKPGRDGVILAAPAQAEEPEEMEEMEEGEETDTPAEQAPMTRAEQLAAQIAELEAELAAERAAEKAREWDNRVAQLVSDITQGGDTALTAFQGAVDSGMLVLVNPDEKPARKVCTKATGGDATSNGAPKPIPADSPYTADIVRRVHALRMGGHRPVDIAAVVGLNEGQVYHAWKRLKLNADGQVVSAKA
jgi:hypothetical protein